MGSMMTEKLHKLKFRDKVDQELYAFDEGLITAEEAINGLDQPRLDEITEGLITRKLLGRNRRKRRVRDHKRSRLMKKLWRGKRKSFMKGIKKFHKSVKGKQLHKKVARNRAAGRYRSINEWYTGINSILTHLSIEVGYTSSINEEVERELLWEVGQQLLGPVLEEMASRGDEILEEYDMDFNNFLEANQPEAALFLDDLMGLTDLINEDCPYAEEIEVAGDDEITMEDNIAEASDKSDEDSEVADNSAADGEDYSEKEVDKSASEKLKKGSDEKKSNEKDGESDEDDVEEAYNPNAPDLIDIFESYEVDSSQFEVIDVPASDSINENASATMVGQSDPDVDGQYVIAKVRGPAFFPGRTSRNNVEYTTELWDYTLKRPEYRKELEARRMYSTFGHDLPIDDESIRDGKIGHIVSDTWIDPDTGTGMAEYLILNSGPGRMIKTLLGAKSKLRVSTRARGKMQNRLFNGKKRPDPKRFYLRGIDFVHDPGFLDAEPDTAHLS